MIGIKKDSPLLKVLLLLRFGLEIFRFAHGGDTDKRLRDKRPQVRDTLRVLSIRQVK